MTRHATYRTKQSFALPLIGILLLGGVFPLPASAIQEHGAPEGLYVHQMAHAFFALSMGLLIYWLRHRGLVRETGWRHIQYAALFLILWNVDAAAGHLLSQKMAERFGSFHIEPESAKGHEGLVISYFLLKLDHLFCVPALLFLHFGLKRLLRETERSVSPDRHL